VAARCADTAGRHRRARPDRRRNRAAGRRARGQLAGAAHRRCRFVGRRGTRPAVERQGSVGQSPGRCRRGTTAADTAGVGRPVPATGERPTGMGGGVAGRPGESRLPAAARTGDHEPPAQPRPSHHASLRGGSGDRADGTGRGLHGAATVLDRPCAADRLARIRGDQARLPRSPGRSEPARSR